MPLTKTPEGTILYYFAYPSQQLYRTALTTTIDMSKFPVELYTELSNLLDAHLHVSFIEGLREGIYRAKDGITRHISNIIADDIIKFEVVYED